MDKIRLCYVDNVATHYRKAIFQLMDEEYDCVFIFGESLGDIKQLDTRVLHGKVIKTRIKRFWGGWSWQPGVVGRLFNSYDVFILIGESRSISTWLFAILSRIVSSHKKTYFWTHGWYGKENLIERMLKKIFLRLPNGGVFLYGNYARELMIKKGFNPNKLYVIHNSLDYDNQLKLRQNLSESGIYKEHFKNTNKNLYFVGRLTPVKQLDMILQAMLICNNRGERYNMTFIGDGEKRVELEILTKKLGLESQVWFYGACYDEKILAELIYNADLCVAPGNVGLTAMHSLVFGTPVITHDNFPYQMPEFESIHKGITGDFFKQGSIESLSDVIMDWFRSRGFNRKEVREACYNEIDLQWTPQFQIKVLKDHLKN